MLVEKLPNVLQFRTNLAWTFLRLGNVYSDADRYDEAEVAYHSALGLTEQVAQNSPASQAIWHVAQFAKQRLIRVFVQTKRYDKAKSLCDRAVADAESRWKTEPDSKAYERGLAIVLPARTFTLAALGQQDDALAAAQRLSELGYDPKETAAWAAMGLSLANQAVTENDMLDETTRHRSAETYAKEAIRMLELAIKRGYGDVAALRTDTDFDPIRNRNGFSQIVKRMSDTTANGENQ